MTKQTAVEWLYNQIPLKWTIKGSANKIFKQAKEMEKQQIIDAYKGKASRHPVIQEMFEKQGEQYYNETYNNK